MTLAQVALLAGAESRLHGRAPADTRTSQGSAGDLLALAALANRGR